MTKLHRKKFQAEVNGERTASLNSQWFLDLVCWCCLLYHRCTWLKLEYNSLFRSTVMWIRRHRGMDVSPEQAGE